MAVFQDIAQPVGKLPQADGAAVLVWLFYQAQDLCAGFVLLQTRLLPMQVKGLLQALLPLGEGQFVVLRQGFVYGGDVFQQTEHSGRCRVLPSEVAALGECDVAAAELLFQLHQARVLLRQAAV